MSNRLPDGHVWKRRELDFDGKAYLHHHCENCGRDFVKPKDVERWSAVYVGVFEFAPLEDGLNLRWLSEACPGRRLPEDRNEVRCRRPASP